MRETFENSTGGSEFKNHEIFKRILDFTAKVAEEDPSITQSAFVEKSMLSLNVFLDLKYPYQCLAASFYVFLGVREHDFEIFSVALIGALKWGLPDLVRLDDHLLHSMLSNFPAVY